MTDDKNNFCACVLGMVGKEKEVVQSADTKKRFEFYIWVVSA